MDEKMKKKLMIIGGGFVGFIIIIFLISSCSNRKPAQYTYEEIEERMVEATKEYYNDHEEELPEKGQSTYKTVEDLEKDGYMSSIKELSGKKDKCSGTTYVENNSGEYLYAAIIDCGDKYETNTLAKQIIKDNLTTEGIGLYHVNDEYIMKGEVTNNYIQIGEELFRIVKINSDGSIRIVSKEDSDSTYWDDRYNGNTDDYSGINEYVNNSISSRLKENLDTYFERDIPEDVKKYIVTQNVCVGKRSKGDTDLSSNIECSKILENQYYSTLYPYEYFAASLGTCNYISDPGCTNYNWLTSYRDTWTLTADRDSVDHAFKIRSGIVLDECNLSNSVHIVLHLTGNTPYLSGDGSLKDPYSYDELDD